MKIESKFPELLYAEASVSSLGGSSLFTTKNLPTIQNIDEYRSSKEKIDEALGRLQNANFKILDVSDTTISIAGTREQFESVFKTPIHAQDRQVIREGARISTSTFYETLNTEQPGLIETTNTDFVSCIEGVAINEPVYYFAESAAPPTVAYHHLNLGDIPKLLNLPATNTLTGQGVKVAMVDSGWYNHAFFKSKNWKGTVHPGLPGLDLLDRDENGHGTGESANIFALAPNIDFHMIKMTSVTSAVALKKAIKLNPDIITCSWGSNKPMPPLTPADQVLAAIVADAISKNIIIIFSAGNGHYGFPGQHPDVISAGGVYIDSTKTRKASNYASGFMSTVYPDRSVPDVCGLVGMQPKGAYIMLPVEPGCEIDAKLSGSSHPNGDETGSSDGWAAFSGTSAAAPQIAGICALLKQAVPDLTPQEAKEVLTKTASDIIQGECSQGYKAKAGQDLATGYGLVDAEQAISRAKTLRPNAVAAI